jgi:hypothetical protein
VVNKSHAYYWFWNKIKYYWKIYAWKKQWRLSPPSLLSFSRCLSTNIFSTGLFFSSVDFFWMNQSVPSGSQKFAFFTWTRRVILYAILKALTKKNFKHKLRLMYIFFTKTYCFIYNIATVFWFLMLKCYLQKIKKIQSPALFKKLEEIWRRVRYISDFSRVHSNYKTPAYCVPVHDFVVAKPSGNCFGAEPHIAYSAESELCI